MKYPAMLLIVGLLTSCVTVTVVPPTSGEVGGLPPVPSSGKKAESCTQYQPPRRKAIPEPPTLTEADLDVKDRLIKVLAEHGGALRTYIEDEHEEEDKALQRHQVECPP
ncbi:hypothetical protein LUCX_320 [Xanthomonas phage vB_XciM_LucasX]|nr:hypothetical protein LUCX_320 [Xanthomonas phage vB_XciM_LucasX]